MFAFGLNSKKWIKSAQKTEKETKSYNKLLYNTWKRIIKQFQVDFNAFKEVNIDKLPTFENSLVYLEMLSFTKRFANIQNTSNWGFYHSALLELQFLLATTTLAYYLDQQLPNTDRSEKIKLMQKHKGELWGDRLRRRAYMYEKPLGAEVEKVLKLLNDSLDEYMADRSVEDWQDENVPFCEKDFNQCVQHSKNISSIIFRHFMKRFDTFTYKGELDIQEDKTEAVIEEKIEKIEKETVEEVQEIDEEELNYTEVFKEVSEDSSEENIIDDNSELTEDTSEI